MATESTLVHMITTVWLVPFATSRTSLRRVLLTLKHYIDASCLGFVRQQLPDFTCDHLMNPPVRRATAARVLMQIP